MANEAQPSGPAPEIPRSRRSTAVCPSCGMVLKRLLTIKDCADVLGMNRKTAREYIRKYKVPVIPLGTGKVHKRIDRRDLDVMIEAMKARTPEALLARADQRRTTQFPEAFRQALRRRP